MKKSKIWLELDRELVHGLLERLARSESDFARRLHRQLDSQLRPFKNIQKKKGLTHKDAIGREVYKMRDRIAKHRSEQKRGDQ